MNDSRLDARIRSALPSAAVPASLDGAIDAALDRNRRIRRIARPVRLAVGVAASAALLFVMGPPVYAQAMVGRIAGALDGVQTLRMTRTSVDAEGNRFDAGEVVYDGGRWRIRSVGQDTLFRQGKTYTFDPVVKAYVVTERPDGPFASPAGIRMSEMLGAANQWSMDRRVQVGEATLDGQRMRRATVENPGLGERYVIYADPQTDLPREVHVEAKEGDAWQLRMIQGFEYGSRVPAQAFELAKGKPVISEAERAERVVGAMTAGTLAELPLRRGRIVVRAVDVAADGTVFIAYQSGDRSVNKIGGFAFDLSDDLGTPYARREVWGGNDDFVRLSKDRKLEVEAFVPLRPVDPKQPRALSFLTRRFKNRGLARMIQVILTDAKGRRTLVWQPNWQGNDLTPPTETVLVHKRVAAPTCEDAPAYAKLVSSEFANEVSSAIFKSAARAKGHAERGDWDEATRWYEEELRQMRRHERMGYGPWAEGPVLEKLEQVRTRTWRP
jgi:hypothetical protein